MATGFLILQYPHNFVKVTLVEYLLDMVHELRAKTGLSCFHFHTPALVTSHSVSLCELPDVFIPLGLHMQNDNLSTTTPGDTTTQ